MLIHALDDPDPLPLLSGLVAEAEVITPWACLTPWLLAVLAATYRAALQDVSRTRLVDDSPVEFRPGLTRVLDRADELDVSLSIVQVVTQIAFVLLLTFAMAPENASRLVWAVLMAAGILLPTVHAIPVGLARRSNAENLLRPTIRTLSLLLLPLRPASLLLLRLRGGAEKLFHRESEQSDLDHLNDEIKDAVEESEKAGALEEDEAHMIEGVLSLQDVQVSEVMTPRPDMTSIPLDASVREAARIAFESGHSKLPVFEGNRDEIRGVFHLRDAVPLLSRDDDDVPPLRETLQASMFVPSTKKAMQLLREFQQTQQSLAIVLDEYGGTEGVITVEDILEEIVGDLRETHDQEEGATILRLDPDVVSVDPRLRIEEVNDELEMDLPESDDYDTVGGFVFSQLDRIPKADDMFVYEDVEFRILEVENRRIVRLQLRTLHHGRVD